MLFTVQTDPRELTAQDFGAVDAVAQKVIRSFEESDYWNGNDPDCANALILELSQAVARLRREGHPRAGAFKRAAERFIADSQHLDYWSF